MATVANPCDVCEGKRFDEAVLDYHLGGKDISEVLGMSVVDAEVFFSDGDAAVPAGEIQRIMNLIGEAGIADIAQKTARRVVTTGCGQGTVFGDMMSQLGSVRLPDASQARIRQTTLHALLEQMRQRNSIHRKAGSVHGCALFCSAELLMFVEDVGRHNAIDTIAGWMGLHGVAGADKTFYTTGRLTSEMVMKSAQMGVPIIVSRNGVTAMGHGLAEQLGMSLFGRAANRHFLCYTGFERFDSEPEPQRAQVRVVSG